VERLSKYQTDADEFSVLLDEDGSYYWACLRLHGPLDDIYLDLGFREGRNGGRFYGYFVYECPKYGQSRMLKPRTLRKFWFNVGYWAKYIYRGEPAPDVGQGAS